MTMLNGQPTGADHTDAEKEEKLSQEALKRRQETYGKGKEGEKEADYAARLMFAISKDLEIREKNSDVFNGIPYSKAYEYNRRKAINYSPPRNPEDDREVSFGLVLEKIVTFCAVFLKYVWKRRTKCYNKHGREINGLGEVYDVLIEHSYRLEKFVRRMALILWEVFTQGNAFVLEDWQVRLVPNRTAYMKDPKTGKRVKVDPDTMDYTYEFLEGLTYEEEDPTQERKACSVLMDGRQVIFSNPEIEETQEMPRVSIEIEFPRELAQQLFGSLDRWKHVPEEHKEITDLCGSKTTLFDAKRLKDPKQTVIAHLVYEKFLNRHNLFLNGVMMLPRHTTMKIFYPRMNYPITNIAGERLKGSIYARSIPAKTKFNADFLDWALKMLADAFEQGVYPSLLSHGKYTITRKMLRGGQVTKGVNKSDYEFANPERAKSGIKSSEFSFVSMLKEIVEGQTVSGTTSGELDAQATATAIATADARAMDKLGFILDGLTLGMIDLAERRIETIESKYTTIERKTIVNKKEVDVYQNFYVKAFGFENNVFMNPGVEGMSDDEKVSVRSKLFHSAFQAKKRLNKKVKNYMVNPIFIRKREYTFEVEIMPEQKKNNQLQMISFWEEVRQLRENFPNVRNDKLQEEYLEISGRPDDLFGSEDMRRLEEEKAAMEGSQQQSGFNRPTVKPNQNAMQARRM